MSAAFAIIGTHSHHNWQTGTTVLCGLRKWRCGTLMRRFPLTGSVHATDGGRHEADSSGPIRPSSVAAAELMSPKQRSNDLKLEVTSASATCSHKHHPKKARPRWKWGGRGGCGLHLSAAPQLKRSLNPELSPRAETVKWFRLAGLQRPATSDLRRPSSAGETEQNKHDTTAASTHYSHAANVIIKRLPGMKHSRSPRTVSGFN